jgi:hypothetical protein
MALILTPTHFSIGMSMFKAYRATYNLPSANQSR